MKIHIVKKGDTLWNIAKMYHVDFEELKQMNAHLAEPDMIMPGMKIRIPVHKQEMKQAKNEHKTAKNEQMNSTKKEEKKSKPPAKEHVQPKTPQQTKPVEQLKEDDKKDMKPVKPVVPFEQQKAPSLHMQPMPTMPKMPDYPHISPVKDEKVETKEKPEVKKQQKKEQKNVAQPSQTEAKGQSIPLTSYGCHCYCGSCTPMHFGEAHMSPMMHHPQQQAHMVPPQPYRYQMMPGMHMQQPVMPSMYDQTYHHPYQPYNMQQMPQMHMQYVPEEGTNEARSKSDREPVEDRKAQPVTETYPPMYSEVTAHRSFPTPPGFHDEQQTNNEVDE